MPEIDGPNVRVPHPKELVETVSTNGGLHHFTNVVSVTNEFLKQFCSGQGDVSLLDQLD
jgi:hypothetical protein